MAPETSVSPLTKEQAASLNGNETLLEGKAATVVKQLLELDQAHIFSNWPPPGEADADKQRLLRQLEHLDSNYNGGLAAYISNAKRLLEESRTGKNTFEGYVPYVPDGERLDFGSAPFREYERAGAAEAGHAAFVLVAGGLGERLGYSGIKLSLPADLARGACFLQVYVESILALQARAPPDTQLPLAIMTSGDTHERTKALLRDHANFGMAEGQITLLKQEKVVCLADGAAHLALERGDAYALQTKPHGHGDVHTLLHASGLLQRWLAAGTRWVCFFQDTNALMFRALPAALGVSARHDYDMNSLAVPRKAKEAIGGIAVLRRPDGSSLTINVEYNLLDPLLRANGHPDGDVNDDTGWSPFPGNINQLVLKAESYSEALGRTGGVIAEFVNPKYADASKTAFKSATRLECMMQDFPYELPTSARVGFTTVNQVWAAYSPVKNSPADARAKVAAGNPSHSATAGELDIYQVNCRTLQQLGATVEGPTPREFNGLHVDLWPRVSWSPLFALTIDDVEAKVNAARVRIAAESALVVEGAGVSLQALDLDGALVVVAVPGAQLTVDGLVLKNAGWKWQALNPDKPMTEEQAIRGFLVCRRETLRLEYDRAGRYVYPEVAQHASSNGAAAAKELATA